MGIWEILDIVDKGVNIETHILLEYWGFHGKMFMMHVICLSGLLGIHLN